MALTDEDSVFFEELHIGSLMTPKVNKHLVCTSSVHSSNKALTLIDSGATANFIHSNFIRANHISIMPLKDPKRLRVADGRPSSITHAALLTHTIGTHTSSDLFYVTDLHKYHMVLGMTFLEEHDPDISWKDRTMTFNKDHCRTSCLQFGRPCTLSVDDHGRTAVDMATTDASNEAITMVSARAFSKLAKKHENDLFVLWPEDMKRNEHLKNLELHAMSPDDFEKFMSAAKGTDPSTRLPPWLQDMTDCFKNKKEFTLKKHQAGVDHAINLKPGMEAPYKKAYAMNPDQLAAVKKYIDEELEKGTIEASKSSCASPVLIVRKPGGGLRVCVDYRALNAITVKDRYPIPLIRETLDRLCRAKFFTKLDVVLAFNNLRIREGDEWLTAFITRYGLYQYKVMPFGLCNGPSSWQRHVNDIMREFLDQFVTVYLDDVLIYSETLEEHKVHVRKVLKKLRDAGLPVDIDKCEFAVQRVKYLGLIVTTEGIEMDSSKVEAIKSWQSPRSVKDVQAFLGFANFYRRFVHGFSNVAGPLTNLTRTKDKTPFIWTADCQRSFDNLKERFTTAPILSHYMPGEQVWVETDASDYVVAGILSQMRDGMLKPVAFFSKKMTPQECNYDIYDKELLAIVKSFEEWKPELSSETDEGQPVQVLSDHKNLEYFMTTKQLNRRQARWAEFLAQFNFKITYRPGQQGTKPDSLTRRSQDLPKEGDPRIEHQRQVLLKPKNLDERVQLALALVELMPKEAVNDDPCDSEHLRASMDDSAPVRRSARLAAAQPPPPTVEDSEDDDNNCSNSSLPPDSPSVLEDEPLPAHPPPTVVAAPTAAPPALDESADDIPPAEDSLEGPITVQGDLLSRLDISYRQDNALQEAMRLLREGQVAPFLKQQKISYQDCKVDEGRLYVNGLLYIPDDEELRTSIIQHYHNRPAAGHPGTARTYELVCRQGAFWPGVTVDIKRYIRNCHVCRRACHRLCLYHPDTKGGG